MIGGGAARRLVALSGRVRGARLSLVRVLAAEQFPEILSMTTGDIQEIPPDTIGRMNLICAHGSGADAPWLGGAVEESARVSLQAAALGRRVFGAFRDGRAVGRVEVMPIDLAPLPLEGEDLHVIRCLWVVQEAQGSGTARALIGRALAAAEGATGVAIVTYGGWNDVPSAFLAKFGFETVQQRGMTTLLLRKASADARVVFAPVRRDPVVASSQVQVEVVISGMCPAATQYYRRLLDAARSLSDEVVAKERMLRSRADALRFGRENTVYVDGEEPFPCGFRTAAFCDLVKDRLVAKMQGSAP